MVLMDTDYEVPAEVDRIRARVAKRVETDAGTEEVETWVRVFPVSNETTAASGAYRLPATFAILPQDADLDREIVVELEALGVGGDAALVRRRVRTGFVRGEARLVRTLLYRACESVTCPAQQSCGCPDGTSCATPACVDEWIAPDMLESIEDPGALPPNSDFPSTTEPDGGMPDGGVGPDDGGTEPDGSIDPDGGSECEPPLTECDSECIDTQIDPRYCGDCTTECPGGFVCDAGFCVDPGDCRTNGIGCSGFTYCDEATGDCLRGCTDDLQCIKDHEVCNVETHECVCLERFERCAFDCVDTQSDPRFCGDCVTSCPLGEVCEAGACLDPGDCRTNGVGCSGFTYCDETTGDCLRGCDDNAQCTGGNQTCNTTAHQCVCAPGFHSCGGICVSDLDVNSCGALCAPCPVPSDSTPICESGVCDFVCEDDFETCGDACCPIDCPPGQVRFDGACASVHIRTADNQGNVGQYASMALDAQGSPRIAYYASSGSNLLYVARQTIVPWPRETADAPGNVGEYASLKFSPQGNATVAYHDAGNEDLKLATRLSGGSWAAQVVDDQDNVGKHASLAFGPTGLAHISYYDETNKDLTFAARQSNGTWTLQTVDGDQDVGQYTSLAFDPGGLAHISYYDESNKDLKLATRQSNGAWSTETIDRQGDVGQHSSLAFGPNGLARIAYYDETSKDLALAEEQSGGAWVLVTVDGQADVGKHASLSFDAAGVAHIAYFDETNTALKHAFKKPGEVWKIETIDDSGDVGRFCSIAVDSQGHAHIGYYDATSTDLKYALIAAAE
ncbi:MAG: hypothetical protein AMJ62_12755 [Myxococcales bacterium SG8_38]|nr:MAG: hypothetical protein AMJ62_12755 [Myxococcales bacterium SG8_38]